MKTQLYKIATFIFLFTFAQVFAQKVDKKFTEKFDVNKDVTVAINASNTEINVETWNKNQVYVEAIIEIEGLSKKEAEKYIDGYNFEALGNKKKVQITSKGQNYSVGKENFVFFNNRDFNFPELNLPNFDNIVIPEFPEIATIEMPNINFEAINFGLDDFDFDFDKYAEDGKKYFFQWKDSARNITIKSKEEWEKFKKTDDYKKMKKELDAEREKVKKEMKKARKEMKKAQLEMRKINKDKIEKQIIKARVEQKKAREEMMKARREMIKNRKEVNKYYFNSSSNEMTINGKKVKITKKLNIKVPKDAIFNLNTRHSKVTLPKTAANGKVSYGSFYATTLNNSDLKIAYSPVSINDLNACTLFLNNVTDAKIASVTNSILDSNSSKLVIDVITKSSTITSDFGDLSITKIQSDFKNLNIDLNNSKVTFPISTIKTNLDVNYKNCQLNFVGKTKNKFLKTFLSFTDRNRSSAEFSLSSDDNSKNKIQLSGKFSTINIL